MIKITLCYAWTPLLSSRKSTTDMFSLNPSCRVNATRYLCAFAMLPFSMLTSARKQTLYLLPRGRLLGLPSLCASSSSSANSANFLGATALPLPL